MYLTLVPVVAGVALASLKELDFKVHMCMYPTYFRLMQ